MVSDNVERAMALLRAVGSGDGDLAGRQVSPVSFVQHDPRIADGQAGLREFAGRNGGDRGLETVRIIEDGPLVVAHGVEGPEVVFAVFRFQDGLVAEQWRFAVPTAPLNESGHSQTDGPSRPDPRQDSAEAKALVRDYYQTVHLGGRHERIREFLSSDRQVRHEPGVRDGLAAFEQDLAVLTRSRTIDEIVLLAGQGDLVFIAARGTHDGRPCAYIDLYRVEAAMLVEHWGFPQPFPSPDTSRNGNRLL